MTTDHLTPLLKQLDSEIRYREAHGLRDHDTALFRDCRLALRQAAQEHEQLKQHYADYGATEDDLAPFRQIAALTAQIQALRPMIDEMRALTCAAGDCAVCNKVDRWADDLAALLGATPAQTGEPK